MKELKKNFMKKKNTVEAMRGKCACNCIYSSCYCNQTIMNDGTLFEDYHKQNIAAYENGNF